MGLDYSSGCVNFRDVGESLELVAGELVFPKNKLLRGGKIDYVTDLTTIGVPETIVNLRRGDDPETLPAAYAHFPAENNLEKYETSHRDVRRWLNEIVAFLSRDDCRLPVLIHCTSGKDRTGVLVAALLTIVGVNRSLIVEEYLLSEGDVQPQLIQTALDGMANVEKYFYRVDLPAVRARFSLEG